MSGFHFVRTCVGLSIISLGLLTHGCNGAASKPVPPEGAQKGLKVTILIYSGRPNPSFVLEEQAKVEALAGLYGQAQENKDFKGSTVLPSILGYNGILAENLSKYAGLPASFAVYRENIEARDETGTKFLSADNRDLETRLLDQAKEAEAIGDRELQFIQAAK